jgi:hypothetical protein
MQIVSLAFVFLTTNDKPLELGMRNLLEINYKHAYILNMEQFL